MQNLLLYVSTVLIWGSTWFAITFQLGTVDPLMSIAYRYMIAALIMMAFLAVTKRLNPRAFSLRQHGFMALQGFFLFCLNYWLFYLGTDYLTSGLVAVVFSTMTLMNTVNQAFLFKIAIKKEVISGSMLGLIGIGAIFWPEIEHMSMESATVTGLGLCLVASYSASLGNMAALRNNRNNIPVMQSNSYGMAWGALFSFVIALMMGADMTFEPTMHYVTSLLYLAVFGSAIGFACYLTLMNRIGADKAAYTTVMFPIVALIISTIFEGFSWSLPALLGLVLVVIGNVIAMSNRKNLRAWRKKS